MNKKLHIVSFDVPYPANYGGVIDVFYKLKALKQQGVDIVLHTYEYGRGQQPELKKHCSKVFYYPRNSFVRSYLSTDPFIVKSRASEVLIDNLNSDESPILFEGLHTTLPIITKRLKQQRTYIRTHNIEHRFYKGLSKSESNIFKRNFFKQEAKKLKRYERVLEEVDGVFSISPYEQKYFLKKYGDKCTYVPAFHNTKIYSNHKFNSKKILYHGNVLVSENVKAALFLIDTYKDSTYNLIIASSYRNKELGKEIEIYPNIEFKHLSNQEELYTLFEEAHINALPTFQKTGIKLKLLNTLYQGKFIIANDFMVEDTGLETLCERANTKEEFLEKSKTLLQKDFKDEIIKERRRVLENFNTTLGAKKIIETIFS
tara:strand:- start:25021 stop:26136 length:1116 start_codon:yes stop_codon:yes gene_type:complete